MVALGALDGQRVELLRGEIVEMAPQSTGHSAPIHRGNLYLVRLLGTRADTRVQLPMALSDDSEPEPDFAIVEPGEYLDSHPTTALLVIEVSASSLRDDRRKGSLYAEAGIPEYWILDVERQRVERYVDPEDGEYRTSSLHPRDSVLEPLALPGVRVVLDELFPKRPQ